MSPRCKARRGLEDRKKKKEGHTKGSNPMAWAVVWEIPTELHARLARCCTGCDRFDSTGGLTFNGQSSLMLEGK